MKPMTEPASPFARSKSPGDGSQKVSHCGSRKRSQMAWKGGVGLHIRIQNRRGTQSGKHKRLVILQA
ncbi:MAG: hypothetical protein CBB71_06420 [Rhodopirellula sp. TMED11]|nr:MAG: hypothetical protein CBB71_06420 [Rhodopirellula sp. TMED11]